MLVSRILIVVFLQLFAATVVAVDSVGIATGEGTDEVDALRVSARWQWPYRWAQRGHWLFTGYWEAGVNRWDNDIKVTANKPAAAAATHEIWVAGFSPVFRWQRGTPNKYGLMPFLEAGIGAAIFSNRRLARDKLAPRRFGSRFQFENLIGAGVLIGKRSQHEVNLRQYHYSNGDFNRLNEGIDLWMLSYAFWLQ